MAKRPDPRFAESARSLESAYLASSDPVEQSGFHGGRQRWVDERSPLVEALHKSGSFLDVGCANGLLVQDVAKWAADRRLSIEPFGVDLGEKLIETARGRHPRFRANFAAADAWDWNPARKWTFVYSLLDLSPESLWCDWLTRLAGWVEVDGRLILGSYGSRSRSLDPVDVAQVMVSCDFDVVGESSGGTPPVTRFAWCDVS